MRFGTELARGLEPANHVAGKARRRFHIALIKPSHYDADGYVIQWHRSSIPANSLASLYGLVAECREDKVLGPDVEHGR